MALFDKNELSFVVEDGFVSFIKTPWDSKVLKTNSISILQIKSPSGNYQSLLLNFRSFCIEQNIGFVSVRIPSINNQMKSALQNTGFRIVEHTLDVTKKGLDLKKLEDLQNRIPIVTSDKVEDYLEDIRNIAANSFHYGRFFEDPFITKDAAALRNKNWINDLIHQKAEFNILTKKNTAIGFLSWQRSLDNDIRLLFGGVLESYQHLSYPFWADVLLKLNPIRSLTTTISSSNTAVMNLYSYFGFNFVNPQFGLHWHAT